MAQAGVTLSLLGPGPVRRWSRCESSALARVPVAVRRQASSFMRGASLRPRVAPAPHVGRAVTTHAAAVPALKDLPKMPIIGPSGRVDPPAMPSAKAVVFAVFDADGKAAFVGFSTDVRTSLLRLLVRQPTAAVTYAIHGLESLEESLLLSVQQAWFDELGAPPPGNGAVGAPAWREPVFAGYGAAAATRLAQEVQGTLAGRGLTESVPFDTALLAAGRVDVAAPGAPSTVAAAPEKPKDAAAITPVVTADAVAKPATPATPPVAAAPVVPPADANVAVAPAPTPAVAAPAWFAGQRPTTAASTTVAKPAAAAPAAPAPPPPPPPPKVMPGGGKPDSMNIARSAMDMASSLLGWVRRDPPATAATTPPAAEEKALNIKIDRDGSSVFSFMDPPPAAAKPAAAVARAAAAAAVAAETGVLPPRSPQEEASARAVAATIEGFKARMGGGVATPIAQVDVPDLGPLTPADKIAALAAAAAPVAPAVPDKPVWVQGNRFAAVASAPAPPKPDVVVATPAGATPAATTAWFAGQQPAAVAAAPVAAVTAVVPPPPVASPSPAPAASTSGTTSRKSVGPAVARVLTPDEVTPNFGAVDPAVGALARPSGRPRGGFRVELYVLTADDPKIVGQIVAFFVVIIGDGVVVLVRPAIVAVSRLLVAVATQLQIAVRKLSAPPELPGGSSSSSAALAKVGSVGSEVPLFQSLLDSLRAMAQGTPVSPQQQQSPGATPAKGVEAPANKGAVPGAAADGKKAKPSGDSPLVSTAVLGDMDIEGEA